MLKKEKQINMKQIWLLWWPNNPATTKIHHQQSSIASAFVSASSTSQRSCVSKLVRQLKRKFRTLGSGLARTPPHGGSKYDPLSYSLNFDGSGSGSGNLDDYYHFYAFSSRFVANPTSCPRLLLPTTTSAATDALRL